MLGIHYPRAAGSWLSRVALFSLLWSKYVLQMLKGELTYYDDEKSGENHEAVREKTIKYARGTQR